MRKAGLWLLCAVSILMAASRAQAGEAFWAVIGPPGPPFLALWDPSSSLYPQVAIDITGLQPSETSLGLALRPATGDLYLVGSTSRLYRLSSTTGVATAVGSPFTPLLSGSAFSVAFDNADRLRVVSNTGQNLRIDSTTAAVTVDTPLAFAAGDPNAGQTPQVVAIAYDHKNGGATAYAIDAHFGLLRLGSATASDGMLTTIAAGAPYLTGFDLSPATGLAYGIVPGYTPGLVILNLQTGTASPLAPAGGQFTFYHGFAVAPAIASAPTLGGLGLACLSLGLALSALLLLRRRRLREVSGTPAARDLCAAWRVESAPPRSTKG
ncbi:MAG TPA: DUF4394 domain-containing protein [Thermoanaerobaculia bacterium]